MSFIETEELYEINLELSKSGEFYESGIKVLKEMSTRMSESDILELYDYFQENSERPESEWREQFVSIFPQIKDELPEIDESEFWGEKLHHLIESKDIDGVKDFITEINIENWDTIEDEYDIYPIEAEDDDCILPIDKAKKLNLTEVVLLLENIVKKLRE